MHIMTGGGQDEPFVPILFIVPILFFLSAVLRDMGLRFITPTFSRWLLKFGVAVGCRTMIILQALAMPEKQSVYFKRYSKVEFFIIAWTAYIIALPVLAEALVSGGTLVTIVAMAVLFPGHFRPEVNPWNVTIQGIAATAFGIGHAYYQQRRQRMAELARLRRGGGGGKLAAAEQEDNALAEALAMSSKTAAAEGEASGGCSTSAAAAAADATAGAAAVSSSLAAVRRIHNLRASAYVSPARPCRFAIKVQHAHIGDLPADLLSVVNQQVLAGSGWQAVSAFAREGCVELVLDLRPTLPNRVPYGGALAAAAAAAAAAADDDSHAYSDQDVRRNAAAAAAVTRVAAAAVAAAADLPAAAAAMDPAALSDLGRSIVAYLHSAGLIRPEREPCVTLQLGDGAVSLRWCEDRQEWLNEGDEDIVGSGGGMAGMARAPTLSSVTPRVAAWPGPGAALRLTAAVQGPSAEEVLAGGGIVVRTSTAQLSYSVVRVDTVAPTAGSAPSSPARGDGGMSGSDVQIVVAELLVHGAPVSGLVMVEARSSGGLVSAPCAVVVDPQPDLVAGLAEMAGAMDPESADAVLMDYGTWLDAAAAAAVAAAASGWDVGRDAPASGGGGSDTRSAAPLRPSSATALWAGLAADVPYAVVPAAAAAVAAGGAASEAVPSAASVSSAAAMPSSPLLAVAADLLTAACQHGGGAAAAAAVVDRLIAAVVACDARPPAAALAALLAAVPAAPTQAGALHLAVAAQSRPVAEVLVRWHERLLSGGASGSSAAAAAGPALASPWVARAVCGVTPLHVAAGLPDGGAMASWVLSRYPAAAAAWRTVRSDDGLSPSDLAALLGGGRWRRTAWQASGAVAAARKLLDPPLELLWGFRDTVRERRYTEAVSCQAAGLLYAALNVVFIPAVSLAKGLLYGSTAACGTGAVLAALAFHAPHAAPLVAWLCATARVASPTSAAASAAAMAAAVRRRGGAAGSGGYTLCPGPNHTSTAAAAAAAAAIPAYNSAAAATACAPLSMPFPSSVNLPLPPAAAAGGELRASVLALHLVRACVKAAMGLGVWPFRAVLPDSAVAILAAGGDIALEAVMRPLLEQIGLPARLLLSLADLPAMMLLYRGIEAEHPGAFPKPLHRALVYEAVLLGVTALVSATNRARFLRLEERSRAIWAGASVAAAAAGGASAVAGASATGSMRRKTLDPR
ncbi:hypothetical protein HYH03_016209 [Edaphochlamys debaryana]|uniref:Uncharacterized protein n=1 Tax=Edaphochlamys debaryana TaxID=47281 RepID=A0A836BQ40_9CHLO|nr:hypothetical protein HYH03_016209 [Edaphochlamys debaryana]|eukprot:KAG2485006.1 hypothetical protein HYH03_016209 [Edaphochlamys debaryana]